MRRNWRWSTYWLACATVVAMCSVSNAQINIIHEEGFNDDGDGTRYTMAGRGQEVLPVGPGMWEHNFLLNSAIGLPAIAPARRAGILWANSITEFDFTEDSLAIWDNLVDFMTDGKEAATIGFVGDPLNGETSDFLAFRLEEAGHTVQALGVTSADYPDASELDLVIQTNGELPDNLTFFASAGGTGYAVPLISFHGGNHDDELISSIGLVTGGGPTEVTVVEANQDHPILDGRSGTIQWIDDFAADFPLDGIGQAVPSGSTTLLTYEENGETFPGLLLIEEGDPLAGAFAAVPDGGGFIVGGDMNEPFPDGASEFTTAATPRSVQLNGVDISGQTGVKVGVSLAATDVDFEAPDFLRIAYSEDPDDISGDFIDLDRFDGMAPGVLINGDGDALNPNEFTEFIYEIPDDVDNLVIRLEAFSTFPNEVLGIDNIRIFTGEELEVPALAGDIDGDGMVAFSDFLILSTNFGMAGGPADGDIDGDGQIAFADFLTLSTNFGTSAAAASVPEPSSLGLLGVACLSLLATRRRRRA